MEKMKVLSIGYDKDLFDPNSRASKRIVRYGEMFGELRIIVFTKRSEGFEEIKLSPSVSVFPTNAVSKVGMVSNAFFLGKKVGKGVSVITCQDPFESAFVGLMLKSPLKAKLHIQEHGDFFSSNFWRNESSLNKVRIILGRIALKQADRIRVVAERIKSTLVGFGINENKIDVSSVYTESSFFVDKKEREDSNFVFISVGRLVSQKNFHLLVDSFNNLPEEIKNNSELQIIGGGILYKSLKNKIEKLELGDKVKLLGHQSDVKSFYGASDVFVLSSNYEGWGRVILEATMAHLPVIMTDVGCAGELIKNKESGIVVPIGNAGKLTEAMEFAYRNKDKMKEYAGIALTEVSKLKTEEESVIAFVESVKNTAK